MAKSFVIVFNSKLGARKELADFLNALPYVTYWYGCLPFCLFVTANATANDLFKSINEHFSARAGKRIIITEVGEDRQGWLPKKAWRVLKNPDDPVAPD